MFMDTSQFVHGGHELTEELRSINGPKGGRASLERDEAVYQNIGSAFCCEFGSGDSGSPHGGYNSP